MSFWCCVSSALLHDSQAPLTSFCVVQYAWMHSKQFNLPKEKNRFLKYGVPFQPCLIPCAGQLALAALPVRSSPQNVDQRACVQGLVCSFWAFLALESRLLVHGGRLRRPKVK